MKKNIFLWIAEIVLGICSSILLLQMYRSINILTLYIFLFAPSLILAVVFAIMIKTKVITKLDGKNLYITCGIFAFIGTIVFTAMNIVIQSKENMFSIIIENTRQILSDQYLVIKDGSNVVDYIMIFVFIFIIYWAIGHERKGKVR